MMNERANQMYQIDMTTLEAKFALFNAIHFDGKLEVDEFWIDDSDDDFCGVDDVDGVIVIGMCKEYDDEFQFDCLLAHEMTHIWQIQNGYDGGHDGEFLVVAKRLEKSGLYII